MSVEFSRRLLLRGSGAMAVGLLTAGCDNERNSSRERPTIPTIQFTRELPTLSSEQITEARSALHRIHPEGYVQYHYNGTFFRAEEDQTKFSPFMVTINYGGNPFLIPTENPKSFIKTKAATSKEFPDLSLLTPLENTSIPSAMVLQKQKDFLLGEIFYYLSLDPQTKELHATAGHLIGNTHGENWIVIPPTSENPEEQKKINLQIINTRMNGGVVLDTNGKPVGVETNGAHRADINTLEADLNITLRTADSKPLPHVPALLIGFTPLWRGDEKKFTVQ